MKRGSKEEGAAETDFANAFSSSDLGVFVVFVRPSYTSDQSPWMYFASSVA